MVAQAAERLAGLPPKHREEHAARLRGSILPRRAGRPTQTEGDGRAPSDELGKLAERIRLDAEDMERAGCFELARTTVSFVCQMLARAPLTSRLLATAHLGRVNRQIGDLPGAVDCYSTVTEQGQAANDGPIAAHGFIGLGNVAHARGNRPQQKLFFEQALELAAKGSPAELSAHQGLMNFAMAQNLLADALLHGWRAHDLAPPDSEVQNQIISNLSSTALKAGFPEAALAGFVFLRQSVRALDRLVAFGQGALAAAECKRPDDVERFIKEGRAQIHAATQLFDRARFFMWSAEAWHMLGEFERVEPLIRESLQVADDIGFHEVRIKCEQLLVMSRNKITPLARDETPQRAVVSVDVERGLGRLQALALC
jgi:hypothetical protein